MQPYMNPYYFQNTPAYQPQQNLTQQYQERLAQLQAQYNQQPTFNQPVQQYQTFGLNGEVVDSIDVVKAKNADLSGNVTFYPKSDMTEIYTKQMQPDGTSRIVTYRAVMPETDVPQEQPITLDTITGLFAQMKAEMLSEIKAILPEQTPARNSRTKGGTSE